MGGRRARVRCPCRRDSPRHHRPIIPPPLSPPRKGEGDRLQTLAVIAKKNLSPRCGSELDSLPSTPRWTGSATNAGGEIAGRGKGVVPSPWAKRTEAKMSGRQDRPPSRRAGQCQKTRYPEADIVSLKQMPRRSSASGPVTLFDIPGGSSPSGASVYALRPLHRLRRSPSPALRVRLTERSCHSGSSPVTTGEGDRRRRWRGRTRRRPSTICGAESPIGLLPESDQSST